VPAVPALTRRSVALLAHTGSRARAPLQRYSAHSPVGLAVHMHLSLTMPCSPGSTLHRIVGGKPGWKGGQKQHGGGHQKGGHHQKGGGGHNQKGGGNRGSSQKDQHKKRSEERNAALLKVRTPRPTPKPPTTADGPTVPVLRGLLLYRSASTLLHAHAVPVCVQSG